MLIYQVSCTCLPSVLCVVRPLPSSMPSTAPFPQGRIDQARAKWYHRLQAWRGIVVQPTLNPGDSHSSLWPVLNNDDCRHNAWSLGGSGGIVWKRYHRYIDANEPQCQLDRHQTLSPGRQQKEIVRPRQPRRAKLLHFARLLHRGSPQPRVRRISQVQMLSQPACHQVREILLACGLGPGA